MDRNTQFVPITTSDVCVALRKEKTHPGPFASWGVALRKESVDRNRDRGPDTGIAAVALRKESVDRNARCRFWVLSNAVALRKESVDRNTSFCPASLFDLPSLSARRAWIEISGR